MWRASISASRLKASSITAWTFSRLTGGLTVMRSVTPATPLTLRTIRSTSCRWYSYSTSPSSVTQPPDTRARTFPSGTCTFHSRTCAMARAMSVSSRAAPDSLTFSSLATALTPYTRSAPPPRGPGGAQPLRIARDLPGQGHRPVGDRHADRVRARYPRVPLQFLDDVIPDLSVGFHHLPSLPPCFGSLLTLRPAGHRHITRSSRDVSRRPPRQHGDRRTGDEMPSEVHDGSR